MIKIDMFWMPVSEDWYQHWLRMGAPQLDRYEDLEFALGCGTWEAWPCGIDCCGLEFVQTKDLPAIIGAPLH